MYKKSLFSFALMAALFATSYAGDKTGVSASKNALVVGERLSYEVSWSNFIVAGELTMETKGRRNFDGVDGYHVSAQAQSVGLVSALVFKVNDVYDSFINSATLQPFRAEKRSRHGKKHKESSVSIDQQARTARFEDGRTMQIPPDTYDLAGLFYAVRAMDMTLGKVKTFHLLEDGKLYTVRVEPEAREKITTRQGSFDVVRITTKSVRGGEERDPYNLRFYVTTDARRLPVLMTAAPTWGEVRVELTSATGTGEK